MEIVMAVQAGTRQHLKGSGETVLMDGRGSVQPEVEIYVEPRTVKKCNRKIAKASLDVLLTCQRSGVDPSKDVDRIDLLRSFESFQSGGSDSGEFDCIIAGIAP